MVIHMNRTVPMRLVNVYAPTADKSLGEKENIYNNSEKGIERLIICGI